MKVLLLYNRIKAFINNIDTFHISFKTSQKITCNIFQRGPAKGYKQLLLFMLHDQRDQLRPETITKFAV